MATMIVRHKVNDFAKWKRVYDDFQPTAKSMGATASAVYCDVDDPNDVTVTHEFATLAAAQALAASAELRAAMETAGVAGPPDIRFANKA